MRLTRRGWAHAALAGLLAGGSLLFARPVLLLGTAGIGAWLLATQAAFTRALLDTDARLDVEYALPVARTQTDETVPVTLTATLPAPASLALEIRARPPLATTGTTAAERTIRLAPGEGEAATTFTVDCPVAGTHRFAPPRITATDRLGLFTTTIERGPTPALTVEPRAPRNVHVGEGGEEVVTAFGDHESGRLGSGLDPAELREYVPGDPARRIDWKATARLDHPYVREFEAETDRLTALLIDHRAGMAAGPDGETKLDYARHVALAFLNSAREFEDPLGLYTVGDGGITEQHAPQADRETYAAIRERLDRLAPTRADASDDTAPLDPATARRRAGRLEDDTAFGATLRPYFAATAPYVERIDADPLFHTGRTVLPRLRGDLWTVILTDDTDRTEVKETVKLARRGDNRVLVFLLPSVLFTPGGLADLDAAYEQYVEFEEFRRDLTRLERVAAFEVGPRDRLHAVLSAGRDSHQQRRQEEVEP